MLPMVLHGPSASHQACYRWSCMGPVLAPQHATDGLAWAHRRLQSMLSMVLYWPSTGPKYATNGLAWAQYWPPKHATNGLAWAQYWPPKHATDGLDWAHCWPPSMLLMVLHGPTASHQACYR